LKFILQKLAADKVGLSAAVVEAESSAAGAKIKVNMIVKIFLKIRICLNTYPYFSA
jgi:hypothetical protein